jgi:hypothetical protein
MSSHFFSYPNFLITLISLRSTLVEVAGSITFNTASTEIGDNTLEYCETT